MKQAFIALMALTFLASCDSGGSSAKTPPKTQEELKKEASDKIHNSPSAVDLSKRLEPESMQIVKANLTPEEIKKFKSMGCDENGNPNNKVDPEFKTGQIFREQSGSSTVGQSTSLNILSKEVISRTNTQWKTHENFDLLENSYTPEVQIENIFSAKPHIVGEIDLNSSEPLFTIPNVTPAGISYFQKAYPEKDIDWSCHVKTLGDNSSYDRTTDELTYQFMGKTIAGYIEKSKYTGTVECSIYTKKSSESKEEERSTIKLGQGTEEWVNIHSNALVQDGYLNCGGASVYSALRVTLDSGRIIYSRVSKKLSAPLRAQ